MISQENNGSPQLQGTAMRRAEDGTQDGAMWNIDPTAHTLRQDNTASFPRNPSLRVELEKLEPADPKPDGSRVILKKVTPAHL